MIGVQTISFAIAHENYDGARAMAKEVHLTIDIMGRELDVLKTKYDELVAATKDLEGWVVAAHPTQALPASTDLKKRLSVIYAAAEVVHAHSNAIAQSAAGLQR